jgi:hypothetical protein
LLINEETNSKHPHVRALHRGLPQGRLGWTKTKKPRNDSGQMKLSAEALQQAIVIRKTTPALIVEQIVFMLQDKHPPLR